MKLKPFKELVKLSKEKIDEAKAPIRAHKALAKAKLEIAQLDSDMYDSESAIQEIVLEKEIDFPKLLKAMDKLELQERTKKQYDKILNQLFPDLV